MGQYARPKPDQNSHIRTIVGANRPPYSGASMIRRHAAGFRALLMAADALLAVVLLVGLSDWRFGADWAIWWRQIVPMPEALLVLYAAAGSSRSR